MLMVAANRSNKNYSMLAQVGHTSVTSFNHSIINLSTEPRNAHASTSINIHRYIPAMTQKRINKKTEVNSSSRKIKCSCPNTTQTYNTRKSESVR